MDQLSLIPMIPPSPAVAPGVKTGAPDKIRDAATQFEALLIHQILQSAHTGGGWLGNEDSTADCASDFAEQQLATSLAQSGGLGIADLIARGLERASR